MYDGLTARYTFACPSRGESAVSLSAFRDVERLPGAAHPAVYRVAFACPCGADHAGLVSHEELDWAPLGVRGGLCPDLMTARLDVLAGDVADLSARRIEDGDWPWTFFCYPEQRVRPVFPSAFRLLAPSERAVGIAVRCSGCASFSVNLVSPAHLDLPFHHDRQIGVVEHVFAADADRVLDEFREELYSSSFEARRLRLA